ncbi:MAG: hypothetical protein HQK54_03450 [Oligoflexales bacterium]|nr:hypothetical protein [Oligoflexales bacterium]
MSKLTVCNYCVLYPVLGVFLNIVYFPANVHAVSVDDNELSMNCEFFVNSFGDAHDEKINKRWLEAEVYVNAKYMTAVSSSLLKVGAFTRYAVNKNGTQNDLVIYGNKQNDFYYIALPYEDHDPNSISYKKIVQFNIFIDTIRADRKTIRYWLMSSPLTFQSTFWGYPYYYIDRGNGAGITYTQSPSPILEKKRNCESSVFLGF